MMFLMCAILDLVTGRKPMTYVNFVIEFLHEQIEELVQEYSQTIR